MLTFLKKILPTPLADAVRPAYHLSFGVLGELVYRFPARRLNVIGVTGTNGKSTTANLIAAVLEAGGHRVGLATTVNFKFGNELIPNQTKMTSLGRFGTYRLLRQMVNAGCDVAVLEVSSHALHWHRVWGINFQAAVFTNLTRDHLDLHKTMDEYRDTKRKLFATLEQGRNTVAVVNGDDPAAPKFLECLADHRYVYGITPVAAEVLPLAHTVLAGGIKSNPTGSTFTVTADEQQFPVTIALPGAFNVANALAAVSVGLAWKVDPRKINDALTSVSGVPGRMESVEAGQPFPIIVDYAHTADAFDNVLKTLRATTSGRLITVFGATGDRDRGKRPDLGKVAAQYSDYLVLTEEDPGSEDPGAIIEEILPGIVGAGKTSHDYRVIVDRRAAIHEALKTAKKDDCVVLLAMGHQAVIVRKRGPEPWDDRVVAREEWKKLTNKA